MSDGADGRVLPRGTLYLWPNAILFVGTDMVNDTHRHFTASVHLAVTGQVHVVTEGGARAAHRGLLVAPNVEQQMDARGAEVIILQVDPETADYSRIRHWFGAGPVVPLPEDAVERLTRHARGVLLEQPLVPRRLWDGIIDDLAEPDAPPRALDPRIVEVLSLLKEDYMSPRPAADLAAEVSLSEGRLIHLFTEQMGLPMRRYTLWLRLRDAFLTLAEGQSLTAAAHRAGFADSAHMTRTFRGMFGLPPSFFQEGRGAVRVEFVMSPVQDGWIHPNDAERWDTFVKAKKGKS